MNNISFANPYLLLLIIPLLLLCIVPFFIAVKKDRLNFHNVTSLIIHIIVCTLLTLVMARFTYELVITETNLYVLADVSYSSHENVNKIDEYIDNLEDNVPKNTKIGVIAFAKDYEVLNEPGEKIRSVSESKVDSSATNIAEALKFAGSKFKNNVIKRIVIISDGKETNKSNIVSIVDQLKQDNVYIDAIYLDNNMKPDTKEIQLSGLDYNKSTFKNKEESLRAMVNSSYETRGLLSIYNGDELVKSQAVKLDKGLNVITVPLETKESGSYDYRISLEGFSADLSSYNNSFLFHQNVSGEVKSLFVGRDDTDLRARDLLYGDLAEGDIEYKVDTFIDKVNIPYTVEDLCKYDEIVLSNIDVRRVKHPEQFIRSLDIAVSEFGKKLITLGNTYIQDESAEVLDQYSRILPTDYGNNDNESKVVALVLDISKSLAYEDRVNIAREAALQTIDILNENDLVIVIGFYGNVEVVQSLKSAADKEEIKEKIKNINLEQGTSLGTGLEAAYNELKDLPYDDKQIMLISDGLPYGAQVETAKEVANKLRSKNIVMNTLNTNQPKGQSLLDGLASTCNGRSYFAKSIEDAKSIVIGDIQDDYKDTVIDGGSHNIAIKNPNSAEVDGITSLPSIKGYYFNKPKNHTNVVLETKYTSKAGIEYDVPIYTSWKYGSGMVASLTTDASKYWTEELRLSSEGRALFKNIREVMIPEVKQSSPFLVDVVFDGTYANLNVVAPSVNSNDKINVEITMPSGKTESKLLAFDSVKYVTRFMVEESGRYNLNISYNSGNVLYNVEDDFSISYSPEYDAFTHYEASNLYHMVSDDGKISEDGNLKLVNDKSDTESYIYDFTVLFISICAALFVVDIMIRKLKLDDLKSFFKIKKRGER